MVTVMVSWPRANPVVSRLPRSTLLSVSRTSRVVATGLREEGVPFASVTVYDTIACCCRLTELRICAVTSTWPPGLVKMGIALPGVTSTKLLRGVSEPVIDEVISGAPSAVAVMWKPNAVNDVVDVDVSETVSAVSLSSRRCPGRESA